MNEEYYFQLFMMIPGLLYDTQKSRSFYVNWERRGGGIPPAPLFQKAIVCVCPLRGSVPSLKRVKAPMYRIIPVKTLNRQFQ